MIQSVEEKSDAKIIFEKQGQGGLEMRILAVVFLVSWVVFCCQGCVPAAIAYGAYKISNAKENVAERQERSADFKAYSDYRTRMEEINLQREKSGLKPSPIMTQDEWKSAQTYSAPMNK
jgi:hypothetical protein